MSHRVTGPWTDTGRGARFDLGSLARVKRRLIKVRAIAGIE